MGEAKGKAAQVLPTKGENRRSWFGCRSQKHFWSSKTSKVGSSVVWTIYACGAAVVTPATGLSTGHPHCSQGPSCA